MLKRYVFSLALLIAVGCTAAPPPAVIPDLNFDNMSPIPLAVKEIDIVDQYKSPIQPPHIEHLFKNKPSDAVRKLLEKTLVAAGSDKKLKVIIDEASVMSEEAEIPSSFLGIKTAPPAERYKARIFLKFELSELDSPDIIIGHAEVIAKRAHGVAAESSLADRDHAFFFLTENLMDDVYDGLRTIVQSTFGLK